jgi:acyl-CoA synthetase (AMP-forming)/AMP-acid ligase II
MVSHRMICWNVLNTVIHDLHHDDVYVNVFPLFHAGGLFTYLSSQVIFGNTTVLTRQFDPAQVLELIERYRDGLRGRADHVPDADHRAQLGDGRPEQPALLHQRRRAAARAAGREVHP